MSIVIGADVRDARREHPGDANGSLHTFLSGRLVATRQVPINTLTDQVSYGSSSLCRKLPKCTELALRQSHPCPSETHIAMITMNAIMSPVLLGNRMLQVLLAFGADVLVPGEEVRGPLDGPQLIGIYLALDWA